MNKITTNSNYFLLESINYFVFPSQTATI